MNYNIAGKALLALSLALNPIVLLSDEKNYDAILLYESLKEQNPEDPTYLYTLGNIYKEEGDLKKAQKLLEDSLQITPDNVDTKTSLGYIYLFTKQYPKSEEVFNDILEENEKHTEALTGLGRVKALNHQKEEARKLYEKALEIDPKNETAKLYLTQLDTKEEETPVKKEKKEEKKKVPLWVENELKRAILFEKVGSHQAALEIYSSLSEQFPENAEYVYKIGILYRKLKWPCSAILAFERALEIDPKNQDARLALAFTLMNENRLDESETQFREVLEAGEAADAYAGIGRIFTLRGYPEIGEDYVDQALALDEKNGTALLYKGQLLLKRNRFHEAAPYYGALIAIDPANHEYPLAWFNVTDHTRNSGILWGLYAEEREKDLITKKWIAELQTRGLRASAWIPCGDLTKIGFGGSDGNQRQLNLQTSSIAYSADIRDCFIAFEHLPCPNWTLKGGLNLTLATKGDHRAILTTKYSRILLPSFVIDYNDQEKHHAWFGLVSLSLIYKNFDRLFVKLMDLHGLGAFYERSFKKNRSFSVEGYVIEYDNFHNQQQILTTTLKSGIPCIEENLVVYYQCDFRRFNHLVINYYTYRYQITNWIDAKFAREIHPMLFLEIDYGHGWRSVKTNQGQLVPNADGPINVVRRFDLRVNRASLQITKVFYPNAKFELYGDFFRDSQDYTTWSVRGSFIYRF